MDGIKAFVAHSSDPRDEKVVGFFCSCLRLKGVEPILVAGPSLESIPDQVQKKLDRCSIFAAIITSRNGGSPPWIHWEGGAAYRDSKVFLVFAEDGVRDLGAFSRLRGAPLWFQRTKLVEKLEQVCQYIEKGIEQVKRNQIKYLPVGVIDEVVEEEEVQTYIVNCFRKQTEIKTSGYGIVRCEYDITVLDHNFTHITQRFGLNEYVAETVILPSLSSLRMTPIDKRHSDAFFAFEMFEPGKQFMNALAEEIPQPNNRENWFHVKFEPKPTAGMRIIFAWAWGFPNLFQVKGEDSTNCLCRRPFSEVELDVLFERPWIFRKDPILRVVDLLGTLRSELPLSTLRRDLCYHRYHMRLSNVAAGMECQIVWESD